MMLPQYSHNNYQSRKNKLKDDRSEEQYLKDIDLTQRFEDKIALKFSIMQGVGYEAASERKVLTNYNNVVVGADYLFEKFGLLEVKHCRRWREELSFKLYQLRKYIRQKARILFINGFCEMEQFFAILEPNWILRNGYEPSEEVRKFAGGKFDVSIQTSDITWHKLL